MTRLKDLTAIGDVADADVLPIDDVSEPTAVGYAIKKISISVLRAIIGGVGGAAPTVSDTPDDPDLNTDTLDWTVRGDVSKWVISILTYDPAVNFYLIYFYSEHLENWLATRAVFETRSSALEGPLVCEIMAPIDQPRYNRRFKVIKVTDDGKGELSECAEKTGWTQIYLDPEWVPSAPSLSTDEYPYVTHLPHYNNYVAIVTNKILAVDEEANFIKQYELQRMWDDGSQVWENPWETIVTPSIVEGWNATPPVPAPRAIVYNHRDGDFCVQYLYRYQVRAIAGNGNASPWSEYVQLEVSDDLTAPDPPVFTATEGKLLIDLHFEEPTQSEGDICQDFWHFIVQYKKDDGDWTNIKNDHGWLADYDFTFNIPTADLDSEFQFRAKTADWSQNESDWSSPSAAKTPEKFNPDDFDEDTNDLLDQITLNETEIGKNATAITLRATTTTVSALDGRVSTAEGTIITMAESITLKVSKDEIIAQINISSEEIKIDASRITLTGAEIVIDGSVTFSAGYDPTTKATPTDVSNAVTPKLDKVGGAYDSAASGARVRIFPDANTGIQITDGTNDVFKALVGGTDVGDVIIGSAAGHHVKWDKSAGVLEIVGLVGADGIKTSSSGIGKIEIGQFDAVEQIRVASNGESTGLCIQGVLGVSWMNLWNYGDTVYIGPDYISVEKNSSGHYSMIDSEYIRADVCYKIGETTVLSGQMTIQTTLEGVISQLKAVGLMAA